MKADQARATEPMSPASFKYGRKRPGGANRCHEILRTMFDCAITWGHRPESAGSPCARIDRYRRPPRRRLRDADDLAKLGTIRRKVGENVGGESSDVG